MIEFKLNISKGSFNLDVESSIPSQGVTALFGPSGCGKTTFLRALCGLDKAEGSYVKIDNEIWQDKTQFIPVHKRSLGFVFQEGNLFPHLSIRKNLEYGFKRIQSEKKNIDFKETVNLLGLSKHLEKMPNELSGGEKQRVAIARALLTSPKLLVLDEPLTGLDQKSKSEILPFLSNLIKTLKIPVLYVSHDTSEIAQFADHVILLGNGKIEASGKVEDIFLKSSSLNSEPNAETVIETTLKEHDEKYLLSTLTFPGGNFYVSKVNFEPGQKVRLRILAKSVSLTLNKPEDTSILNIISGEITEITEINGARMNIKISAGDISILSHITKKSAEALNLEIGKKVFAQIKSVELLT